MVEKILVNLKSSLKKAEWIEERIFLEEAIARKTAMLAEFK